MPSLALVTPGCAERVAVIHCDFNGGGDYISEKDVQPSFDPEVALGIRLAARGLFNVSTAELRAELREAPAGWESLFTLRRVWPLVCQRLREAHGLAPDPRADPRPLILVCEFDEFQLFPSALQKLPGVDEQTARDRSQAFQRALAYLVMTEGGDTSPAAKHGVYLLPMLLGTSLSALQNYEVSLLKWTRDYLQPLCFADSCKLFEHEVLRQPGWADCHASQLAFFRRLTAKPHVLATLELAGGIAALVAAAAMVCHLDAVESMPSCLCQSAA